MADAFKKICKIHKNLPPGGILVFLTGRMEVNQMVAKLRRKFGEENKNLMDMKEPFKEKDKADATKNGDSSNGTRYTQVNFQLIVFTIIVGIYLMKVLFAKINKRFFF